LTTSETTVTAAEHDLSALSAMSLHDLISSLASRLTDFAIHLAIAILVFYVGRFVITRLYRLTNSIFTRRNVDASLSTFILSLLRILLYFILIVTVIGILGIETSSFLALFASAGVAIGMALSGTLQNFAGGVLILLLKPYKVGDFIETQGYSGTVREIQIFSTILNTPDNKSIIVPNGPLSTGTINNYSREKYRRVEWTVNLAYGDDIELARKSILDILTSDSRIIAGAVGREPAVYLDNLADSSVVLKCRAWTASDDYWSAYYAINERIYQELPARGLHFPYPQLDVHIESAGKNCE